MRRLTTTYRVLALIVGVLLTVLVFVGMPLEYLTAHGSAAQHAGERITMIVGIAHGWIYMAYIVTAFLLSRRAGWSLGFTLMTLLAGLLPIFIFWVERRVAARVAAELAGAPAA